MEQMNKLKREEEEILAYLELLSKFEFEDEDPTLNERIERMDWESAGIDSGDVFNVLGVLEKCGYIRNTDGGEDCEITEEGERYLRLMEEERTRKEEWKEELKEELKEERKETGTGNVTNITNNHVTNQIGSVEVKEEKNIVKFDNLKINAFMLNLGELIKWFKESKKK